MTTKCSLVTVDRVRMGRSVEMRWTRVSLYASVHPCSAVHTVRCGRHPVSPHPAPTMAIVWMLSQRLFAPVNAPTQVSSCCKEVLSYLKVTWSVHGFLLQNHGNQYKL